MSKPSDIEFTTNKSVKKDILPTCRLWARKDEHQNQEGPSSEVARTDASVQSATRAVKVASWFLRFDLSVIGVLEPAKFKS